MTALTWLVWANMPSQPQQPSGLQLELNEIRRLEFKAKEFLLVKPGDIREHKGRKYIVDKVYWDTEDQRWEADETLLINL
jgi:hypothetical protein